MHEGNDNGTEDDLRGTLNRFRASNNPTLAGPQFT
jgi:hypothetical protein